MKRVYEFPFVVAVEGDDRDEAAAEADDLADCIEATFPARVRSAVALIGEDHNLLDRMKIERDGCKQENFAG